MSFLTGLQNQTPPIFSIQTACALRRTAFAGCKSMMKRAVGVSSHKKIMAKIKTNVRQTAALIQTFRTAAEAVSAIVSEVETIAEAISYAVDLFEDKEACNQPMANYDHLHSDVSDASVTGRQRRLIAAPLLSEGQTRLMQTLCKERGIVLIKKGLRDHPAGIDIGFTMADYGIAETGTLIIDSSNEELRLTTMISDIHVAVLPVSRIRPTAFDFEKELRVMFAVSPNYFAFITGASRTADIERILALGVHGPLALHILLLKDH